jgi:hypothetical protein
VVAEPAQREAHQLTVVGVIVGDEHGRHGSLLMRRAGHP